MHLVRPFSVFCLVRSRVVAPPYISTCISPVFVGVRGLWIALSVAAWSLILLSCFMKEWLLVCASTRDLWPLACWGLGRSLVAFLWLGSGVFKGFL